MTKDQIIQLIINNLPAVIAVAGIIFTFLKFMISFKSLASSIEANTNYEKLLDDLKMSIQETYELKRIINQNLKDNEELKKELNLVLLKLSDMEVNNDDSERQENQA